MDGQILTSNLSIHLIVLVLLAQNPRAVHRRTDRGFLLVYVSFSVPVHSHKKGMVVFPFRKEYVHLSCCVLVQFDVHQFFRAMLKPDDGWDVCICISMTVSVVLVGDFLERRKFFVMYWKFLDINNSFMFLGQRSNTSDVWQRHITQQWKPLCWSLFDWDGNLSHNVN